MSEKVNTVRVVGEPNEKLNELVEKRKKDKNFYHTKQGIVEDLIIKEHEEAFSGKRIPKRTIKKDVYIDPQGDYHLHKHKDRAGSAAAWRFVQTVDIGVEW